MDLLNFPHRPPFVFLMFSKIQTLHKDATPARTKFLGPPSLQDGSTSSVGAAGLSGPPPTTTFLDRGLFSRQLLISCHGIGPLLRGRVCPGSFLVTVITPTRVTARGEGPFFKLVKIQRVQRNPRKTSPLKTRYFESRNLIAIYYSYYYFLSQLLHLCFIKPSTSTCFTRYMS